MNIGDLVFYQFNPVVVVNMEGDTVTQVQGDYVSISNGFGLKCVPHTFVNAAISEKFRDHYSDLMNYCKGYYFGDILRWLEARWLEMINLEKPSSDIWGDVEIFKSDLKYNYKHTVHGCRLHMAPI